VLHRLAGHTRGIWSLSFAPNGRRLANGGGDGITRLWSLGAPPGLHLTLIGMPGGWAAVAPDGRYKVDGAVGEAFWYAIGMRRFEIGELDDHLAEVTRLSADASF
jgi:WD40 repeat protein